MGNSTPPRDGTLRSGSADLGNEPMTAVSAARYYTDTEIAIVVHQMLTGLDQVAGRTPDPPWHRATADRQALIVAMVVAARRGCTTDDLHRMQAGPAAPDAISIDRPDRLRWGLFLLIVGAMAGEER
jgi:hypothetical protein